MVKEYLDQINGKMSEDVNMFTGGLNTYMDKGFLNPDQLPYSINMTMYKPPMVCTRASRERVFSNIHEDTFINAMWAYNDDFIVYITKERTGGLGQDIYARIKNSDGTYSDYDPNTYEYQLPTSDIYFNYARTATDEWLYLGNETWKGKCHIDPNNTYPIGYLRKITDNHYGIPCWHKGRLFLADPTTNIITFSALNDFDNFNEPVIYQIIDNPFLSIPSDADTDVVYLFSIDDFAYASYYYNEETQQWTQGENVPKGKYKFDANGRVMIDYSSYAGDFFVTNAKGKIRMIISFDDKLVIFCEHSIHLLYGDTPLTTSSSQFQLVDFTLNLGCQAPKTVAISGEYLFWLGDDREIYSFTGSSLDMISRPNSSRYVNRGGGISNLKIPEGTFLDESGDIDAIATATSSKYYIQLPIMVGEENIRLPLFVYDIYNKIWWAEDGDLESVANFAVKKDHIIMYSMNYQQVLKTTNKYIGSDYVQNLESGVMEYVPIYYEFHTRVYAPDGVSSRKTLSKVWLQASASCDVFLTDSWLSSDAWSGPFPDESLKKIGELGTRGRKEMNGDYLKTYDPLDYEQQYCVVPKMYGERLNTFQIVIRGFGESKFYLMKREWSAR